jgi:O-antigen/teichoic acid export membrane protein
MADDATATLDARASAGDAPRGFDVLSRRAAKGVAWSTLGFGGMQLVRFAGNLVLTRLLFPEAFGVMAVVNVFMEGLGLFSDVGIGPSIIQNPEGAEPRFLNTAFTIQAMRGAALWAAACAGAWPMASFYPHMPELRLLIPAAGATAFLEGFNSTKLFSAHRRLELKRVMLVELAGTSIGLGCMVIAALVHPSVWALVLGGLSKSASIMLLSHLALRGERNRFAWDARCRGALFRFGRWIFFSTMLGFVAGKADQLVFAKMIPEDRMGVYYVTVTLLAVPTFGLSHVIGTVLFPFYSRLREASEELGPWYAKSRVPGMMVGAWAMAGLIAGGPTVIRLLYDPRYASAGWMLQALAVGSWFVLLESTNGVVLLARGEAHFTAAGSLAKVIGMGVLIPLGYHLAGFPGAVVGLSASELGRYTVSTAAARAAGLKGLRQDLALSLGIVASAAAGHLATRAAERAGAPTVVEALTTFVSVTALWAPAFALYVRRNATPIRAMLARA